MLSNATDDERLIQEGEAAVEHYTKEIDSARRQILPMARGLCAAKRKYPATQAFGGWLQGSPYWKIGQTDRAALIQIGAHEGFAPIGSRSVAPLPPLEARALHTSPSHRFPFISYIVPCRLNSFSRRAYGQGNGRKRD